MIGISKLALPQMVLLGSSDGGFDVVANGTTDNVDVIAGQLQCDGGILRLASKVYIDITWSFTASANQKIFTPYLSNAPTGGSALAQQSISSGTQVSSGHQAKFWNAGSLSVQRSLNAASWQTGGSNNAILTRNIDTSIPWYINFAAKFNNANSLGDTITLEEWIVFAVLGR